MWSEPLPLQATLESALDRAGFDGPACLVGPPLLERALLLATSSATNEADRADALRTAGKTPDEALWTRWPLGPPERNHCAVVLPSATPGRCVREILEALGMLVREIELGVSLTRTRLLCELERVGGREGLRRSLGWLVDHGAVRAAAVLRGRTRGNDTDGVWLSEVEWLGWAPAELPVGLQGLRVGPFDIAGPMRLDHDPGAMRWTSSRPDCARAVGPLCRWMPSDPCWTEAWIVGVAVATASDLRHWSRGLGARDLVVLLPSRAVVPEDIAQVAEALQAPARPAADGLGLIAQEIRHSLVGLRSALVSVTGDPEALSRRLDTYAAWSEDVAELLDELRMPVVPATMAEIVAALALSERMGRVRATRKNDAVARVPCALPPCVSGACRATIRKLLENVFANAFAAAAAARGEVRIQLDEVRLSLTNDATSADLRRLDEVRPSPPVDGVGEDRGGVPYRDDASASFGLPIVAWLADRLALDLQWSTRAIGDDLGKVQLDIRCKVVEAP